MKWQQLTLGYRRFHLPQIFPSSRAVGSIVDGKIVHAQPRTTIGQGNFLPIPIMIGSMTKDTRPYVDEGFQNPVSPSKYATLLSTLKPSKSEDI